MYKILLEFLLFFGYSMVLNAANLCLPNKNRTIEILNRQTVFRIRPDLTLSVASILAGESKEKVTTYAQVVDVMHQQAKIPKERRGEIISGFAEAAIDLMNDKI